jgi:hypothetical protein
MMANEKRLIDANKLRVDVMAMCGVNEIAFTNCYPYWKFAKSIENAPTVDAVEVVHGRWIRKEQKDHPFSVLLPHCSECGALRVQDTVNYCPNCGAKMDGDSNE